MENTEGKCLEFTILMPCLNEEKTVGRCVRQAAKYLEKHQINGEVLVIDNMSRDASVLRAKEAGARVEACEVTGYGAALLAGIGAAAGKYVIFGDCDCSYDFGALDDFVEKLRNKAEVVIGNRFAVKMEKGAMPFSHKYIGVPVLSFLGRLCFETKVRDFHCGLRGINREAFLRLGCSANGMEFATEMIGRAVFAGYRIEQTPVKLHKDMRGHKSHLRSLKDGIRHLKVIRTLGRDRKEERKA